MRSIRPHVSLYFVMGSQNCYLHPEDVLSAALKGGVTIYQYREKGEGALQGDEKWALGKKLRAICSSFGVPFIVNDDIDLALELDADGLHIGQEDGSITKARERIGSHRWLGVSAHNAEEAIRAVEQGADYLGVGPMYATSTKSDCRDVQGPSILAKIRAQLPLIPLVGIGGISEKNVQDVLNAGADGVAVVSAISLANDPQEAVSRILRNCRVK